MAESLSRRVGRIISGTVNSVVDSVENMTPDVVMEQAIREVDSAIDEVRTELGRVIAARHLASDRLANESKRHEDLSEKIRVALAEGREDLAEAAIAKLMDIEAQIPVIESSISESKERGTELERYVEALKARRREMRDELKAFRAAAEESTRSEGDSPSGSTDRAAAAVDRAGDAFERVMSSNIGLSSGDPVDAETAKKLAELDDLARENRIKERLAAFKTESE